MMFLMGFVTLAATATWARGQSRMTQPSTVTTPHTVTTPQQSNNLGALSRSSFLTAGFGANPLAALGAYGGTGAFSSLYGNPYAASALGANAYGGGYGASPYSSGYGGSGTPYTGNYIDPGAEEIKAQGQFMVSQQQAYYFREKVRAEKIDNKRKAFDEYLYERQNVPNAENERRLLESKQVQRARNNPPASEIWSGQALNDVLKDLKRQPGYRQLADLGTQQLPLDRDGLKHINLTRTTGNIALLKDSGRLEWPVGLSGPEYQVERQKLTDLAQDAVKLAEFNGNVPADIIRQLSGMADAMRLKLRNEANSMSADLYIEAKGFLSSIDSAITALKQGDVSNHFNGKYDLRATTIPELVRFMSEHGLQFAPALPADRTAYTVLHQAMTSYDLSPMVQTTAR
jgi:hypothetical protein